MRWLSAAPCMALAPLACSTPRSSAAAAPGAELRSASSDGPIARENRAAGSSDWLITRIEGDTSQTRDGRYRRQRAIEGYVSHTSVRAGEVLTAFVSTEPPARYDVEVYRMGYYGGAGARSMLKLGPFEGTAQGDPVEGERQLVEARWPASFEIAIPSEWQSGVYLAKLTTRGSGYQSYLVWVVRDERKADLMFQVSDLTWQAYNRWPGWRSLYDWKGDPWHTKAVGAKVSFDRPYGFYYNKLPANFVPKTNGSGEFLLWEFPLAFWLESRGYDVTYVSGLDTHRDGEGITRVKGFLSVGHDEYWSRRMFDNVTRARDAGVSLAFLSGNAVDGEITFSPSSAGRPERVFERATGQRESNEFDDEHQLMGATSYGVGLGDWIVRRPEHWLFAGTSMKEGDRVPGLVGWEYQGPPLKDDPSLVVLASGAVTSRRGEPQSPDYAATLYDGPRGNIVFNAATCWWSMLLAAPPGFVNPPEEDFARSDPRVQRMTQNLVERMIQR
ncbi:MAG TPA: N,N-dimethylformamidase beta subunit family domain-containing protein [Polyangiaceae bacterium]|nr:N,N-dimethylformamidase beta subunit family domain-containing protein [Polyangiaceae bacterium]